MPNKQDAIAQYSKAELQNVAEELGLQVPDITKKTDLVDQIFIDIDANGVPEFNGISDTLAEFLIVSEYTDAEGNVLDAQGEEVESEDDVKPECFTYYDSRDPSCSRCKALSQCKVETAKSRPPCFGNEFFRSAEECKICIESGLCSQVYLKSHKEM